MAERIMNSLILIRSDTKANWTTADPTLKKGEVGIELDTNRFKIGDNSTAWNSLGYYSSVLYGTLSTSGNTTTFTQSGTNANVSADTHALYIDTSTKKIYRYNGSDYVVIGGGADSLFVSNTTNATSAAASTSNGNTYIHLYNADNSTNDYVKLTGSGFIKVTNDASNVITIQNTVGYSSTGGSTNGASKLIQANSSGYLPSSFVNGAASSIINSNLTTNKVLISDSNGKVTVSSIDSEFASSLLGGIATNNEGYTELLNALGVSSDNATIVDVIGALESGKVDKVSGRGLVSASNINGHINIDGVDTTVYDLPVAGDSLGGIKTGYSNSETNTRKYAVTLDSNNKAYVEVNWTDNNTTYTFANGTNGFTVTPLGGSAQNVTITIPRNVVYKEVVTPEDAPENGRLVTWDVTTPSGQLDPVITVKNGPYYYSSSHTAEAVLMTDSSGKISVNVLPDSVVGQLEYKGPWNATTPGTLTSDPEKGWYFICSTAGGKNPSGGTGTSYAVGDWAVYNGTTWDKIDNTDAVTGVKGGAETDYRIGNVNITKANIGLGNVDNTSDSTKKTNFTGSIAENNTGFATGGAVYSALSGKVNTDDILILNGGHAGYATNDSNYESSFQGRWTERSNS